MRIIHFTTVHPRDDSRIRYKMVATLHRRYPNQVSLYVQDGLGAETDPLGFGIVDTGPRLKRLVRMTVGGWRMFRAVVRAKPMIAHFHDPELLPWALLLRLWGIKVIYDVHEHYPDAVTENYNLPKAARVLLPPVIMFLEWFASLFLNGIVLVVPSHKDFRFPARKTIVISNFPQLSEFNSPGNRPMWDRPREVAYIGTINLNRNILGMIDAVEAARDCGAVLRLAGQFPVESDAARARAHPGWSRVHFDGWVSRAQISQILSVARAGLVVLKPIAHEKEAYPIKLFEYMAAGVPVIASDFPVWRKFVEESGCGLLVNPVNTEEIASAIRWVMDNPLEAQKMGERGRSAILKKYNWDSEVQKLFHLVGGLCKHA